MVKHRARYVSAKSREQVRSPALGGFVERFVKRVMVQTGQLCTGKISVLYLRVKGKKVGEDIESLAGTVGVTQMFGECILS